MGLKFTSLLWAEWRMAKLQWTILSKTGKDRWEMWNERGMWYARRLAAWLSKIYTYENFSLAPIILCFSVCACATFVDYEKRLICEASSTIQFNATLKGGMRNKRIKYFGRRKTSECSEMVCRVGDADYAFMLQNNCYAVTCLTTCEVIASEQNEETRLIGIKRTGTVQFRQ